MSEEVKQEGEFKLKTKTPKIKGQGNIVPEITKIDLSKKPEEDAVQTQETDDSNVVVEESKDSGNSEGVVEEVRATEEEVVESPIELVEDESNNDEEVTMVGGTESPDTSQEQKEVLPQAETQELPENVDKLVTFMKETGGTIEDYARLNADYSGIDGKALLREYYKQAKPHLDSEEIQFIIEDSFNYDEELDEQRDIRKKKLAYKEEVAKAKGYLDSLKDKYYAEIKLRPGVNQEQQKAIDFFNRYNEEQELSKVNQNKFHSQTDELLNNEFKGFDFKVGEKKFRYGIKDPVKVADNQKDISTFIKTFLNDKGEVVDTKGYHKALYAARNADTIANHFYEQGKTDAIKGQLAKSKNISTEPRKTQDGNVFIDGFKVKAVSGLDSSKLKIKTRKFNN
jgi:hypothetical protein